MHLWSHNRLYIWNIFPATVRLFCLLCVWGEREYLCCCNQIHFCIHSICNFNFVAIASIHFSLGIFLLFDPQIVNMCVFVRSSKKRVHMYKCVWMVVVTTHFFPPEKHSSVFIWFSIYTSPHLYKYMVGNKILFLAGCASLPSQYCPATLIEVSSCLRATFTFAYMFVFHLWHA